MLDIMYSLKPLREELHVLVARCHLRIVLTICLFVYLLFSFGEWRHNSSKRNEILDRVNLLRQMQDYAKQHCQKDNTAEPSSGVNGYSETFEHKKGQEVAKTTVNKKVTFIVVGPTIQCLKSQIDWLNKHYNEAKIFVALSLGISVVNQQVGVHQSSNVVHFLGGFMNIAEALNHAIRLVNTEYFMVIDHEIDLMNMEENFVELFLTNILGSDLLSGSMVTTKGEFYLPCQRLGMQYWSYHESYQFNVSDNKLQCDGTLFYFIARNEAFRNLLYHNKHLFDVNLTLKWTEDFFFRFKNNLKVGVLPEVVIRQMPSKNCINVQPRSASKEVELLIPFAKKHQLFYMSNETTCIDVCADSNTLACSEQGVHKQWGFPHWADRGLTTYPFIIHLLQKALHFGTKQLEKSGLMYVVEGGTLLGLVKLRDILPWDHGDVDTFVYSTRRKVIDMVKATLHEYGYEFWLRHTGFHTYVTDDPNSWNGCIVYLTRRVKPKAIVFMRHHGKLFPVKRYLFGFLRQFYGSLFLENHMKVSNQRSYCLAPGHHACMPDCRWDGCGGGL